MLDFLEGDDLTWRHVGIILFAWMFVTLAIGVVFYWYTFHVYGL